MWQWVCPHEAGSDSDPSSSKADKLTQWSGRETISPGCSLDCCAVNSWAPVLGHVPCWGFVYRDSTLFPPLTLFLVLLKVRLCLLEAGGENSWWRWRGCGRLRGRGASSQESSGNSPLKLSPLNLFSFSFSNSYRSVGHEIMLGTCSELLHCS